MKIYSNQYIEGKGWTREDWPEVNQQKTLLTLFAAPELCEKSEAIQEIISRYPHTHIIGCSSSGEIFNDQVFDQSLSLSLVEFDHVQLRIEEQQIDTHDSHLLGNNLAKKIEGPNLKAVIVLSDGLNVNGTALVRGMNECLNDKVAITGGLAGDGQKFEKTFVITKNGVEANKILALGLYGKELIFSHGTKGGWDIFGPERIVTKSKENVLYEVDNLPALQLYKQYLGEMSKDLPASALLFPLQIRSHENDKKRLVRTILKINEEEQSLTFAGDIPEGSLVQLMKTNFERLIDGAYDAAESTECQQDAMENPLLVLAISCVGRRLVLKERTDEEVEATLGVFPAKTIQVGFYSYGELSPLSKGEACELHNQSMSITTIGEKKVA